MRELSIEEKATRYDEALKVLHKYDGANIMFSQSLKEEMFPELKESEDEKIRGAIINEISLLEKECVIDEQKAVYKSWIAWLEKQGAKVSAIEGFETEFERQVSGLIASVINKEHEYNQGYVKWTANALLNYAKHELEKQGKQKPFDYENANIQQYDFAPKSAMEAIKEEKVDNQNCVKPDKVEQKPAWSEEDNNCLSTIIAEFSKCAGKSVSKDEWMRCNDFLNSIKNRVLPQPKQEWSEEDSPYYDDICDILMDLLHSKIAYINKNAIQEDLDWIKSLKDRVQPKQEWSEEDKTMLESCISLMSYNDAAKEETDWLKHLRPQLKQPLDEDTQQWIDSIIKDYEDKLVTDMEHCATINAKISILKSIRPQSQWKPSEEQMKVLKKACDEHWEPDGLDPLYTLYQDLKKLREE